MVVQVVELSRRNFSPWTSQEVASLRDLAHLGAATAAEVLGRSIGSVKQAAHRHRISLRRPGCRRGLVLGQPRSVSWASARSAGRLISAFRRVREEVLAGQLDMAELENEVTRAAKIARGDPLCPGCSRNPQEIPHTGLCRDCHYRRLAEAHRGLRTIRAPRRELWRAKQHKSRSRRSKRPGADTFGDG